MVKPAPSWHGWNAGGLRKTPTDRLGTDGRDLVINRGPERGRVRVANPRIVTRRNRAADVDAPQDARPGEVVGADGC